LTSKIAQKLKKLQVISVEIFGLGWGCITFSKLLKRRKKITDRIAEQIGNGFSKLAENLKELSLTFNWYERFESLILQINRCEKITDKGMVLLAKGIGQNLYNLEKLSIAFNW